MKRNEKQSIFILCPLITVLIFLSSCIPIEGSIDDIRERAWISSGNNFIVTFNSNGGTTVDRQYIKTGEQVIRPEDPTKTSWEFAGWYISDELTERYVFSTPVENSFTLYASWAPPEAPKYTVTFNSTGGTPVNQQLIYLNERAEKPANPTMDNHVFFNWYYSGTETIFDFSNPITGDVTLTAKWNIVYYVKYNANYPYDTGFSFQVTGSGSMANSEHVGNTPGNLRTNAFVSRGGYVFSGWSLTSDGAVIRNNGVDANNLTTIAGATVDLWAKWNLVNAYPSGGTLDQRLGWIADYASSNQPFSISVSGTHDVSPKTFSYGVITLTGTGTIQLSSSGVLFSLNGSTLNMTSVTLKGRSDNTGPVVFVSTGGKFIMNSGYITGNTNTNNSSGNGGGVRVYDGGTFEMVSGYIQSNISNEGGGVYVYGSNASFTMKGGYISNNTSNGFGGGGIYIGSGSSSKPTFKMEGGTISNNTINTTGSSYTSSQGGGVYASYANVTMSGNATITGNTATGNGKSAIGGGVYVYNGTLTMGNGTSISNNTADGINGGGASGGGAYLESNSVFNMSGGTISGNKARTTNASAGAGGGVYLSATSSGTFNKTGGTIYGRSNATVSNRNQVFYNTSTEEQYKGSAVYVTGRSSVYARKDTDTTVTLTFIGPSTGNCSGSGDWDAKTGF